MKQSHFTMIIGAIVFLSILSMPLMLTAENTYYIAMNGRDSNDGSIDSPWATLNSGVDQTNPGDTILIRSGNYHEGKFYINTGGANGKFLTIKPYPEEKVTFGKESEEARIAIDADYVRIEGLYFINTKLRTTHGGEHNHIQFVNNHLRGDHSMGAIEFTADDGLIEGNIIECDNKNHTQSHGIYLHFGKNNIVRNNYVSNAPYYTIHIYDEDKGSHKLRRYENVLVENNIVVGSNNRAGIIIGAHDNTVQIDGMVLRNNVIFNNAGEGILIKYQPISNIEIYNNVIYNNDGGIRISADINGLTIRNNIFASNTGAHVNISSNINNLIVSHNLYHKSSSIGNGVTDTNPVYDDPLFVDPTKGNFHLQENSPAIDAGVAVGLPYKGSGPDIGAFEYGQSLSVDLFLFKAFLKGDIVQLEWRTTSETNNLGFEIERSLNKVNFHRVGFVKGHGTCDMPQSYQFQDKPTKDGKYYYRLKQLDSDGSFEYSSTVEITVKLSIQFNLHQNYPNPFNPSTEISYNLLSAGDIDLSIFDLSGRHIITLVREKQSAGERIVEWNGKDENNTSVPSGIYFCRLKVGEFSVAKKMLFAK